MSTKGYIYKIYEKDNDVPAYIGMTEDTEERFKNHFLINSNEIVKIEMACVGTVYDAKIIHTYLLCKLHPRCNKEISRGKVTIDIDLSGIEWEEVPVNKLKFSMRYRSKK